jgi:molybdopterin biosynthesis enzyme MoaB
MVEIIISKQKQVAFVTPILCYLKIKDKSTVNSEHLDVDPNSCDLILQAGGVGVAGSVWLI